MGRRLMRQSYFLKLHMLLFSAYWETLGIVLWRAEDLPED
jgi:hypothetical protein